MSERIPVGITIRVVFKVYLSSDHITPATGKTVAVTISKNGAAFANPAIGALNATEIANGWYYADLAIADISALGPLITRGTCTNCDDSERDYTVVAQPNFKKAQAFTNFMFWMRSSVDHISGKTGLTFGAGSAQISKDGGAFADFNQIGTIVAVGSGWYNLVGGFTTTEMNCNNFALKFTGSGADDTNLYFVTNP